MNYRSVIRSLFLLILIVSISQSGLFSAHCLQASAIDETEIIPRYDAIRNSKEIKEFRRGFDAWKTKQANKWRSEIDELDRKYSGKTRDYSYYFKLGKILYHQNRYAPALNNLDKSIAMNSEQTEAYIYKSFIYAHLEKTSTALSIADKILKIDPQSAEGLLMRGHCKHNQGRTREALKDLKQASGYCRDREVKTQIYHTIALCYESLGNSSKMDEYYDTAIKTCDDKEKKLWLQLFKTMSDQSIDKIHSQIDRLIVCNPYNSESYTMKGMLVSDKKDQTEALINYEKARILGDYENSLHQTQNDEVYFNMGAIFLRKKYTSDAIPLLNKAIEKNRQNTKALFFRGIAYAVENKINKAKSDFNTVIKISPGSKEAKDAKEALELLRQGIMP